MQGVHIRPAVAFCAFILVVAVVALTTDSNTEWLPKCIFHECTGLLCFGCGSTRAVHALIQGDWAHSLRCNALLLPSLAWLFALCLVKREDVFNKTLYAGLAVLVAYMVLRNIPLPLFNCLRP